MATSTKVSSDFTKRITIETLHEALDKFIATCDNLNLSVEEEDAIQIKLARILRKINPGFSSKLHEFIAADDAGFKVNKHGQGVDMIDSNKGKWESKYSKYYEQGYAHFIWKYPVRDENETDSKYRKRILNKVREKTDGGGIIFDVGSKSERYRTKHIIKGDFILAYFTNIPTEELINNKIHNMRTRFCNKCDKYHRLEYLNHYQKKYKSKGSLTDKEWKMLRTDTNDKCL